MAEALDLTAAREMVLAQLTRTIDKSLDVGDLVERVSSEDLARAARAAAAAVLDLAVLLPPGWSLEWLQDPQTRLDEETTRIPVTQADERREAFTRAAGLLQTEAAFQERQAGEHEFQRDARTFAIQRLRLCERVLRDQAAGSVPVATPPAEPAAELLNDIDRLRSMWREGPGTRAYVEDHYPGLAHAIERAVMHTASPIPAEQPPTPESDVRGTAHGSGIFGDLEASSAPDPARRSPRFRNRPGQSRTQRMRGAAEQPEGR